MRLVASLLVKGASNVANTDTIGVRWGADYASAREFATLTTGSTNVCTALVNNLSRQWLNPVNMDYALFGVTTSNTLMFMHWLDDEQPAGQIWVRRNSAQIATSVLSISNLGEVLTMPGKTRTREQMMSIFTTALCEGVKAGVTASDMTFGS